jgi:predicted negative regulator of RcsB-dependent stress response
MTIWWKLGGVLAIVAALIGAALYLEHLGYQKCEKEMQAKNLELALAYADRIVKAEGERDANQTTIDRLNADVSKLRIHIPVCPNSAKDQNGTAGIFSERVDKAFAELQGRGTELFKRCDEMNLDAIKVNASMPAQ